MGRQPGLLEDHRLAPAKPNALEEHYGRSGLQVHGERGRLAGALHARGDDAGRRLEPAPLHLLREALDAGDVPLDQRRADEGSATAGPFDPSLAHQLTQGVTDGDQAAAIAGASARARCRLPGRNSPDSRAACRSRYTWWCSGMGPTSSWNRAIGLLGRQPPRQALTGIAHNVISNQSLRRQYFSVHEVTIGHQGRRHRRRQHVHPRADRRAHQPPRPPAIDELVLHDLDLNRLQVVGGLAQRMLDRVDWPGRLTLTDDARPPSTTPISS